MPEIQTRLIPLGEQPPTAWNVSARIDLLLPISFPLTIFLMRAAQLPATPSIPSAPADGGSLAGCYWLDSQVFWSSTGETP